MFVNTFSSFSLFQLPISFIWLPFYLCSLKISDRTIFVLLYILWVSSSSYLLGKISAETLTLSSQPSAATVNNGIGLGTVAAVIIFFLIIFLNI